MLKKELLIKNIRGDFGKGIIIATASILYAIFRLFNILDNRVYCMQFSDYLIY